MNSSLFRIFFAGASLATGMTAAEPAIIAKAREYLGTEAALDAVKSVHMIGKMEGGLVGATTPPNVEQVDIVFQKPFQESLKIVTKEQLARKVLDDYNGWQLVQILTPGAPAEFDPTVPQRLTILGLDQIRILRADTWENLEYYRGLEQAGGTTEDLGPATIDGVACEKVALRHSDAIVYYRYFDLATGRLVYTETYAGAKIREQGEIMADGVRFPKTITVDEPAGGKPSRTVITIDSVKLNEVFPENFFATPAPPLPRHPPVATEGAVSAPAPSAATLAAPSAAAAAGSAAPAPSASSPSAAAPASTEPKP